MLVVVTREIGRNLGLRRWLPDDATIVEAPLTETRYRPPEDVNADLARASGSGRFAALVVTSARAIGYVRAALTVCSREVLVWSVGPVTTRSLAELGVAVAGEAPSASALAARIEYGPVLQLGARVTRHELRDQLTQRGIASCSVACYETVGLAPSREVRSLLARADVVVIGAPSAWTVARDVVARDAWVVVPGATTRDVVRADHDRVLVGWNEATGQRLAEFADERGSRGR